MRKKASLQDLYRLYQVVVRIPKIVTILDDLLNSTVENVIVSPLKVSCEVIIATFKFVILTLSDIIFISPKKVYFSTIFSE